MLIRSAVADRIAAGLRKLQKLFIINGYFGAGVLRAAWRRVAGGSRHVQRSFPYECMVSGINYQFVHVQSESVEMARAAFNQLAHVPLLHPVDVTRVRLGNVTAERLTPRGRESKAVLLYLHGGGYLSGSPATHRRLVAEIAMRSGMPAVVIDYRLVPEHPFPAALADAWAAYWALLAEGYAPHQIIVGGESAGAGLTMALLQQIRATGLPQPAGAVLMSPWVDMTMTGASVLVNESFDYLNRHAMGQAIEIVLNGRDPHDPYLSPIYADLTGLPPLLIQSGTAEILYDDGARLAAAADAAGVPVEFEPWEGMAHAWHFTLELEPKARAAINSVARFMRRQTGAVEFAASPGSAF